MSDPFSWLSPTQTSPLKDRFPALEFVPCPGDPQASKHVATIVQRTAKSLDEISDALHGTDDADWKGQHADAFREQFDDDFRPKVDKAKRSFSKAASALTTWADEMPAWQRKAELLEKQAQDAKDALRAARGKLSDLPPSPCSIYRRKTTPTPASRRRPKRTAPRLGWRPVRRNQISTGSAPRRASWPPTTTWKADPSRADSTRR